MTSKSSQVNVEVHDGVAEVTLVNPEHGNALTQEMCEALAALWDEVGARPEVQVVVVTGTGTKFFCTGVDVGSVAERGRVYSDAADPPPSWSPRFERVPQPVLCAVNGAVCGAGLHFVGDADIVVASTAATFFDTHVNVGMVGALENMELLRRLPFGTVMKMTLMGRSFRLSAMEAMRLGLADDVAEPGMLSATVRTIADAILANSPAAVRRSKRAIWSTLGLEHEKARLLAWQIIREQWSHPDFTEGPQAFHERRPPRWAAPEGT